MNRRSLGTAGALAAASLVLTSCAGAQGADDGGPAPRPVTVVLDWTPNTNHSGLYLAEANGWFAEAGLDVEIVEPGETSGLQLLATGHADFAYSVAEALVPARAQGTDVVSVAAVIEHNTSSLIFRTDSGITRPADLAGKTYGTYGSDLENALIRRLVECDGGDPDAVGTAPLATYDFRIGLQERQFDYVWVFDAWDTIKLRDLDGLDVDTIPFIEYTDCIPDWYTPLVATTADRLAGDPDLVRDFLAVLARGYGAAMTDPAAATESLLAAAPELDPDLVRASAEYLATRYAADPEAWGAQDEATWTAFVAFLEAEGMLGQGFDVAAAWSDEYLPAS